MTDNFEDNIPEDIEGFEDVEEYQVDDLDDMDDGFGAKVSGFFSSLKEKAWIPGEEDEETGEWTRGRPSAFACGSGVVGALAIAGLVGMVGVSGSDSDTVEASSKQVVATSSSSSSPSSSVDPTRGDRFSGSSSSSPSGSESRFSSGTSGGVGGSASDDALSSGSGSNFTIPDAPEPVEDHAPNPAPEQERVVETIRETETVTAPPVTHTEDRVVDHTEEKTITNTETVDRTEHITETVQETVTRTPEPEEAPTTEPSESDLPPVAPEPEDEVNSSENNRDEAPEGAEHRTVVINGHSVDTMVHNGDITDMDTPVWLQEQGEVYVIPDADTADDVDVIEIDGAHYEVVDVQDSGMDSGSVDVTTESVHNVVIIVTETRTIIAEEVR